MRLTLSVIIMLLGALSAQAQQPPGSDIWMLTLSPATAEESQVTVIEWRQITDAPFYHNQPYFSADGAVLYYTAADAAGQTDLYQYNMATSTTRNITQSSTSEYSPTPRSTQPALSGIWVDKNGKQWLAQWSFDAPQPQKLLDVEPIGYHVWLNDSEVLVFVLSTEEGGKHSLQRATILPTSNNPRIIDTDIGASLWAIPQQPDKFSYSKRIGDVHYLMEYDASSHRTRRLALLPTSSQYYAWTPDGRAVTVNAEQNGLISWAYGAKDGWQAYVSIAEQCPAGASRLVFSTQGTQLALVCQRSQ
ncbi:TolB family protein [Alteromonas flava]|uniref:TolB family protein n=1 Tax=Alteromonas flava TaxID=2048003 RepID=UPI000C283EE3|nr:PD40 domain-containing protein [Alteromonas flava]